MNDFEGVDLAGKTVIVRNPPGTKHQFSKKERTFHCKEGPGCSNELKLRTIKGKWDDGTRDTINSYDIEAYYNGDTLVKRKKEIEYKELDVAPATVSQEEKPKAVRRKR